MSPPSSGLKVINTFYPASYILLAFTVALLSTFFTHHLHISIQLWFIASIRCEVLLLFLLASPVLLLIS
jgi:hypothetical protein